mgnify:CR=1 FL=1
MMTAFAFSLDAARFRFVSSTSNRSFMLYDSFTAALRYPRGTAYTGYEEYRAPVIYGKSEVIYEEEDIAILSVGHMFEEAVKQPLFHAL